MNKVLVFGTGGAAENLLNSKANPYDIIAFTDNDPKKHGSIFHGYHVYSPREISSLTFDSIVVASMWFLEIRDQLVSECGISSDLIRPLPKSFSSVKKKYRPFEDADTRVYAGRVLHHLCTFLEAHNIPCYVNHGTLLGLVRDNEIMPWDDDLDLSVYDGDKHRLYELMGELISTMPDQGRMQWRVEVYYNSVEADTGLALLWVDTEHARVSFSTHISFFRFESGLALEKINWALDHHFRGGEWRETALGTYRIPSDCDDYLTVHYGNWRTPIKDMAFAEIDSYKKHEAPHDMISWDLFLTATPIQLIEAMSQGKIHGSNLTVLLSHPSPSNRDDRIAADIHLTCECLTRLASIMTVNSVHIRELDFECEDDIVLLLQCLHTSRITQTIRLFSEPSTDLPASIQQMMETTGTRLEAPGVQQIISQLDWSDLNITPPHASTVDAIRHIRCQYNQNWTLWNSTLGRCPGVTTACLEYGKARVQADVVDVATDRDDLKTQILNMARHRPCDSAWCMRSVAQMQGTRHLID